MKYLVLTWRNPDFNMELIPAHYEFLDELRAAGHLQQSGPFTDKSGGAYVLNADSLDEARRFAAQDPLNLRRCSTIDVREWDAR